MKVIKLDDYGEKRRRNEMCMDIVRDVHRKRTEEGKEYTISEMKPLAEEFLETTGYEGDGAVPIIKIAKECGFKVVWGAMKDKNMSGFVSVGQENVQEFGEEKVIGINKMDELGHQRFVIAHELAHYLLDYDTREETYFDTYIKNSNKTLKEHIANTFAANLLMPAKYFVLQLDENITMEENVNRWANYFDVQKKSARKRIAEVMQSGV